jgi:hypothetical protein
MGSSFLPHGAFLEGGAYVFSKEMQKEEPMFFRRKCTPDRSKLFGSHGQRPWV